MSALHLVNTQSKRSILVLQHAKWVRLPLEGLRMQVVDGVLLAQRGINARGGVLAPLKWDLPVLICSK